MRAILSIIAFALLLSACNRHESYDNTVRVVSWGGRFQADLVESWIKPAATSQKLVLQTEAWDGDYGALTARIEKSINTWDLVHVESIYVKNPRYRDLFETIEGPKFDTLSPDILADAVSGPIIREAYAVPTLEYAYIVAGRSVGKRPISTIGWKEFWDLHGIPGRRGLRDFPVGNIEAALVSLGHDPKEYLYKETDPVILRQHVTEALNQLSKIAHSVTWWKTGDALQLGLESGDMVLAGAWSGRVLSAFRTVCRDAKTLESCSLGANPKSAFISTDWWVIPKGAAHRAAASRLLNAMYSLSLLPNAQDFSKLQGYMAPVNSNLKDDPVANAFLQMGSSANRSSISRIDEEFWGQHFDEINQMWNNWRTQRPH